MGRSVNFLVVITARGESKGIPYKNIRKVAGRPLVDFSVRATRGSRYFRDFDLMCSNEDVKTVTFRTGTANFIKRDR